MAERKRRYRRYPSTGRGNKWLILGSLLMIVTGVAAVVLRAEVVALLSWSTTDCQSESEVRAYLDRHPKGWHRQEAQACLQSIEADNAAWAQVDCENAASVRAYLDQYPDGVHSEEAQACLQALTAAAIRKQPALFAKTLGREPSPTARDENGWTDLHYAAALNLPTAAAALLAAGASADARLAADGATLAAALQQRLRALGKNYDGWQRAGEQPLHLAARENARETAALLIQHGADVNATDKSGHTPLHIAAERNARATAELLIARGADVHAKNNNKVTPLYLAAGQNARATAELLIERGANVNAASKYGATPLHAALLKHAHATAQLLINRGANLKATSNGWAPLHIAVWENAFATAKLLVEQGADINAGGNNGQRPPRIFAKTDEMRRLLSRR